MRETLLDVAVDFDYAIVGDNNTTPVSVNIINNTAGADTFEWTFEGGDPSQSSDKNPGKVTFSEPGEHRIILVARNKDRLDTREMFVRVDPAVTIEFDYRILVNDFAPAQVEIENLTVGASSYRWTFEGGEPATSNLADPGIILFKEAGAHKISLTVSNGSESFTTNRAVILSPKLLCDFTITPAAFCTNMEAPLTAILKNTSRSSLYVLWESPAGFIADRNAEETTIRFDQQGTYTVMLRADNLKEQKSSVQQITVLPSSGIYTVGDLRFGISQARNTIGCFYSSAHACVLKSDEITSAKIGSSIEIGFFALNSAFDHCYFFSPDKAAESAFPAIPGAMTTQINNKSGNSIARESFEAITTTADMNAYDFTPYQTSGPGDQGDTFTLDDLPVFSFFVTEDGRRGIAMIKQAVRNGAESYAVADVKMEK